MNQQPDKPNGPTRDPGLQPPPDLPRVPRLFWTVHPDLEIAARAPRPEVRSVLECLGSPPFPKTGFPFIGFLATVYDHVAAYCGPAEAQ